MSALKLEYRFATEHLPYLNVVPAPKEIIALPIWSYAQHLSPKWDLSRINSRMSAVSELLCNLDKLNVFNRKIDLTPLKKDQRISGKIYGENPLQNMYDIIQEYANRFPEEEFYGKWGGWEYIPRSAGFAFYVENEVEAQITQERLTTIASDLKISIDARHEYGIVRYKNFVTVDSKFKSKINNKEQFRRVLLRKKDYPHFAHDLFENQD